MKRPEIAFKITGNRNPMMNPKHRATYLKVMRDDHPMRRPGIAKIVSEKAKGRIFSEEHRRNIGLKSKGRNPFTNIQHPMKKKANRQKVSTTRIMNGVALGERNPNWKGGISKESYCESWSDKTFKLFIKERDHQVCQNCGTTQMLSFKVFSKPLAIHHVNYDKQDCKESNLITLCPSCNSKANSNRDFWELFYIQLKEMSC